LDTIESLSFTSSPEESATSKNIGPSNRFVGINTSSPVLPGPIPVFDREDLSFKLILFRDKRLTIRPVIMVAIPGKSRQKRIIATA
jgi:hypothetical protein